MDKLQLQNLAKVTLIESKKKTELFDAIKELASGALEELNTLSKNYSSNIFNKEGELILSPENKTAFIFKSNIPFGKESVGIFLNLDQESFNEMPFLCFDPQNHKEKLSILENDFLEMIKDQNNYEKLKFVLDPQELVSNSIDISTKKSAKLSAKIRELK